MQLREKININSEKKEELTIAKTIEADDLLNLIYQGESIPQDRRFLPIEEGGVFEYFSLEDLIDPNNKKEDFLYPIVEFKNKIVGLAELQKNPHAEKNFWIKGVNVDSEYRGRGYSRKLIEEICRFANERGFSLTPSSYSEEGKEHNLERIIQEFAKKFSVDILNNRR